MIRLILERTEGKYLKPGDLFTDKPEEYWTGARAKHVSAPLFICLNDPEPDDDELVFKVSIAQDKLPEPEPDNSGPMMDPFAPPGVRR